MSHAGWDHFTPDPNTENKMYCRVCEDEMEITRGIMGPTGSIEAMGGHKHLHDTFACKHSKEEWHLQVLALKIRIEKETSQKMADILTEEMEGIIKSKQTTRNIAWKHKWF